MIEALGTLGHEVTAGAQGDLDAFDREGYGVGRAVFSPELLRELRVPLIDAMLTDGVIDRVDGEVDRFRWRGDEATFDKSRYAREVDACIVELVKSGKGADAFGLIWGRPAALWQGGARFMPMAPATPTRVHRDGWHMMGIGAPKDHGNLWIPLTKLEDGDGALAIAVGSHRLPDQPPEVPMSHPVHLDLAANTGNQLSPETLAPMWHSTRFDVGDALLFRPDIVHATTANEGPFLRLAIVLLAQDARLPLPPSAGMSEDLTRPLSDIEWLTLALLSVQPTTRWLARCAFYSRGVIGRLWSEQPSILVERAFVTLSERQLIEPDPTLGEEREGIHAYFRATPGGRLDVAEWLTRTRGDEHLLSCKLLLCDWLDMEATGLLADHREQTLYERELAPVG